MLVYCKDNLPKVKISTRTFEDTEEEENEDEFGQEVEITEVLVEGRAKIKNVGNGKRSRMSDTP